MPKFFVPYFREIKNPAEPASFFLKGRRAGTAPAFLLESLRPACRQAGATQTGRWSWALLSPFMRFRSRGRKIEIEKEGRSHVTEGDPFQSLKRIFKKYPVAPMKDLPPFVGGAAGLLSYELKNQIERPYARVRDPYGIPDIDLGFFDEGAVWDHKTGRAHFFVLEKAGAGSKTRAENRFDASEERLCDPRSAEVTRSVFPAKAGITTRIPAFAGMTISETSLCLPCESPRNDALIDTESNRAAFKRNVLRIQEHIRQGDIFQANLSHVLEFDFKGDAFSLYRRHAVQNPTPFAAFADFGDYELVCGSPERLVKLEGRRVETRPIAGTRPRAHAFKKDLKQSLDLFLSPKERAEHIMLVDLERSDLGRVASYGSVRVSELMALESYSNVHHIVSNVAGKLAPKKDAWDLVRAVFPGGTITGAPKIRAIQILEELEGKARGPYTGSLGFFGFHGTCDLNIVIRSLVVKEKRAYLAVGAGIVADSDPDREYEETLAKAQAFLKTLRTFKTPRPKKLSLA